jgi:hypothetical protein
VEAFEKKINPKNDIVYRRNPVPQAGHPECTKLQTGENTKVKRNGVQINYNSHFEIQKSVSQPYIQYGHTFCDK